MATGDFVQSKTAAIGSTINTAITLNAAPTSGNLLVAFVAWDGGQTPTATAGWTLLSVVASANNTGCFAYKVAGGGESATQEPLTLSGANTKGVSMLEYAGPWSAAYVDVEGGQVSNGTAKASPGVDPVDGVSRLVIGAAFSEHGSGTTYSNQKVAGSTGGVTERTDFAGSGNVSQSVWDRLVVGTVAGTYAASVTASTNDQGAAFIVMFAVAGVQTVNPTGIASAEAFGVPSIVLGVVTISPTGIPSAEAFGTPAVRIGQIVAPLGIPSAEAFGAVSLILGPVTIHPASIASAEAFGVPTVSLVAAIRAILFRAQPRSLVVHPDWPRRGSDMSNTVYAKESPLSVETQEILPITFDTSELLEPGETPASPTAKLVNLLTGAEAPTLLNGGITVAGAFLTQGVHNLVPATRYRLLMHFKPIAGIKEWTMAVDLHCAF